MHLQLQLDQNTFAGGVYPLASVFNHRSACGAKGVASMSELLRLAAGLAAMDTHVQDHVIVHLICFCISLFGLAYFLFSVLCSLFVQLQTQLQCGGGARRGRRSHGASPAEEWVPPFGHAFFFPLRRQ